jgi:ribonuclease-3
VDDVRRTGVAGQDFKSTLQELLQSRDEPLPEYRLVGTIGPDHDKKFHVAVVVRGASIGEAVGPSKKEAEQEAARAALDKLRT